MLWLVLNVPIALWGTWITSCWRKTDQMLKKIRRNFFKKMRSKKSSFCKIFLCKSSSKLSCYAKYSDFLIESCTRSSEIFCISVLRHISTRKTFMQGPEINQIRLYCCNSFSKKNILHFLIFWCRGQRMMM